MLHSAHSPDVNDRTRGVWIVRQSVGCRCWLDGWAKKEEHGGGKICSRSSTHSSNNARYKGCAQDLRQVPRALGPAALPTRMVALVSTWYW